MFRPRRDERELAARLARALDGSERADGEVAALAAVLERAAEPARFEVGGDEVERALAGAQGRLATRRARRPLPRIALAFAAAAAVAGVVLVVTLVRLPGVDVQDKARAALGGEDTVLRVTERIVPARRGAFRPLLRDVVLDPGTGRARWTQYVRGMIVETTLVEHGRVSRYLPRQNVLIVGSSCRAFASGCADVVDPLAFYRDALLDRGVEARRAEVDGRDVYRLTLPVQTLPDAVRIEQRATIDARTFLPREIEWREQRPGGRMRTVSRILFADFARVSRPEAAQDLGLEVPSNVRVIQRRAPGARLRLLGVHRVPLMDARRLHPHLLWLGPQFEGRRLVGIDLVRWNAGSAYRLRYRGITLWTYSKVIPPPLAAGRAGAFGKPLPLRGRIAYFYATKDGKAVAELDIGARSIALVAPTLYKEDYFRLIQELRPLR